MHGKASKIEGISTSKLGTLEAIIKRMPTRYKSEVPAPKPLYEKDESTGKMIQEILDRYPQHKRVLFLKAKYENNETLNSTDIADLKRIRKLF